MIKITDVRAHLGDSGFLVDDGKTAILFDSGFGFTGKKMVENIKRLLGERPLDYIFLSHSHYDHILGAFFAKKEWQNAVVVAGEHTAEVFKKEGARRVMRELDEKFARECGVEEYEDVTPMLSVDVVLKDGESVLAGDNEYRAIYFPGHTKCSTGFYLESKKLLLGSETLGVYDGENVMPIFLVGYALARASLEKALSLSIDRLLVPHFGDICGKEKVKSYLESALQETDATASLIKNALERGVSKPDVLEILKERFFYNKFDKYYPIAAMELNTSIMINLVEKELLGV